jgi:hypothetical protein
VLGARAASCRRATWPVLRRMPAVPQGTYNLRYTDDLSNRNRLGMFTPSRLTQPIGVLPRDRSRAVPPPGLKTPGADAVPGGFFHLTKFNSLQRWNAPGLSSVDPSQKRRRECRAACADQRPSERQCSLRTQVRRTTPACCVVLHAARPTSTQGKRLRLPAQAGYRPGITPAGGAYFKPAGRPSGRPAIAAAR